MKFVKFLAEVVLETKDNSDEKKEKGEKEIKKNKKKLNKSLNFLANSIVRLDKLIWAKTNYR